MFPIAISESGALGIAIPVKIHGESRGQARSKDFVSDRFF